MKVVFYTYDSQLPWNERIDELRNEFPGVEFVSHDAKADADLEDAHAVVGVIPRASIQKARELQMVFISFTGPNRLPLKEFQERGIRLSNTHGNARFVAERAIAMTLMFYGKMIDFHQDLKNSKWHGMWGKGLLRETWDSIQGKTCTVAGTGEIGKWIARFLKAFGCNVVGFKNRPVEHPMEDFDEIVPDLTKAVEKSEIIYVTLPLTPQTTGMFDKNILDQMHGKFLVNVGRGEVIDEEALYHALKNGVLKGAGIDVWYTYPERGTGMGHPSRYPIHTLSNVVLSPHIAGLAQQAVLENFKQTFENIRSYLKTGHPVFEVDLNRMY